MQKIIKTRSGFFMSFKLLAMIVVFSFLSIVSIALIGSLYNRTLARTSFNYSYNLNDCITDAPLTTIKTMSSSSTIEPSTSTTSSSTTRTTTSSSDGDSSLPIGPWTDNPILPSFVKPIKYILRLNYGYGPVKPNMTENSTDSITNIYLDEIDDLRIQNAFTEPSQLSIEVMNVVRLNRFIVLHASYDELSVLEQDVYSHMHRKYYSLNRWFFYKKYDYYVIELSEPMEYNEKIRIDFKFQRRTNTTAIQLYEIDESNGSILTTNFKPIYARNVFPCFDDPSMTATFDLEIEHPENTIAISNYPIQKSTSTGTYRTTTFEMSANKLSTYMLSWLIAPNEDNGFGSCASTQLSSNVTVYGRKELIDSDLLKFSLDTVALLVAHFKDYMGEELKKIDVVALPNVKDEFEAIEAYGLIKVKEELLVYSSDVNTLEHKQLVSLRLAKLLALMLIENKASSSNRNIDLWFNEALASFLSYKAIDAIYPEFGIMNHYIGDELAELIWDESLPDSKPIRPINSITKPEDVLLIYEIANIKKATAILRMIESIVEPNEFKLAVQKYLNLNQPTLQSFSSGLKLPNEMANVDPKSFVENWITQSNYPKLSIVLNTLNETNVTQTTVSIYQEQFESLKIINNNKRVSNQWLIYLRCTLYDDSNNKEQISVFLNSILYEKKFEGDFKWIKCNHDFAGLYLIEYSTEIINEISNQLKDHSKTDTLLIETSRANLIYDSFTLAYLSKFSIANSPYQSAYKASSYMNQNEEAYLPWRIITWHLKKIADRLEQHFFFPIAEYSNELVKSIISKKDIWSYSNTSDEHSDILFKSLLIDFSCRMYNLECLSQATQKFKDLDHYLNDPDNETNPLPVNQRFNVYKYHLQTSVDYDDWKKLYEKIQNHIYDENERRLGFIALANSRSTWILNNYLRETFENSTTMSSLSFDILSSIGLNPTGRYLSWYFIKNHKQALLANENNFLAILLKLSSNYDNKSLFDELSEFLTNSLTSTNLSEYDKKKCVALAQTSIDWLNNKEKDFSLAFLNKESSLLYFHFL